MKGNETQLLPVCNLSSEKFVHVDKMKQTQTTSLQFSETAKAKPVEVVQQADLLTEREAHQSLCEHKEDQECLDTVNGQLMLEQEDSQDETAQLQADVQLRKQLSVATSLNEKENSQLKAKLEKVTKQLEQVQTAHQATVALLKQELVAYQTTVVPSANSSTGASSIRDSVAG